MQASSSIERPTSSPREPGPRKRRRTSRTNGGNCTTQHINVEPFCAPKIKVKELLDNYGDVLERSAEIWLKHPGKFFKMDDVMSALEKVADEAIEKALCIFTVAGSSKNHSKMIQVITAYTFQQVYGGKHMHNPRLKNLRQRGSRFTTLVNAFGYKSVLLLMPCASFAKMSDGQIRAIPSQIRQDDFVDLKIELRKYETLAEKLIVFVKEVLQNHMPVRSQIHSDDIAPVHTDDTGSAQTFDFNSMFPSIIYEQRCDGRPIEAVPMLDEGLRSKLLQVLFLFNDLPISKSALFRGIEPQKVWAETGEVSTICIAETNHDESWTSIFSGHTSLQGALEECIQDGSIIPSESQDGEARYSLSPYWQERLQKSFNREELVVPGAMLVAHVFPREECLDQSFHRTGKFLLPYVHLVLANVMLDGTMSLPVHVRGSLVEMYLACCRTRSRQSTFLPVLSSMTPRENLPDHLTLAIAEVQSIVHRAEGRHQESSKLIRQAVQNVQCASIRSHCQRGRLLLSLAENLIVCESFQEAELLLGHWEKRNERATSLEVRVLRMKNTVIGRISRYKGDFEHAARCLKTCLQGVQTEAARYHVEYHLADVYCELGDPDAAEHLLGQDVARLESPEVTASKTTRRLLLPLAEARLLQGRWKKAETNLTVLARMFDGVACSDASDQLGHVRSIIGLARITFHGSDYDSTIIRTKEAIKLVQGYSTFTKTSYYLRFLYRLQASAYQRIGNSDEAGKSLELSNRFDRTPRHYMTGLGTYAMDPLEFANFQVS